MSSVPWLRQVGPGIRLSTRPRTRRCTVGRAMGCNGLRFVVVSEVKPDDRKFGTKRLSTFPVVVAESRRDSEPGWVGLKVKG